MTTLKQQHLEAINQKLYYEGVSGTELATACEAITIEHMGKFAEWHAERYEWNGIYWQRNGTMLQFTTSELIALYFESLNPKL